jgi:hypothetical protein
LFTSDIIRVEAVMITRVRQRVSKYSKDLVMVRGYWASRTLGCRDSMRVFPNGMSDVALEHEKAA